MTKTLGEVVKDEKKKKKRRPSTKLKNQRFAQLYELAMSRKEIMEDMHITERTYERRLKDYKDERFSEYSPTSLKLRVISSARQISNSIQRLESMYFKEKNGKNRNTMIMKILDKKDKNSVRLVQILRDGGLIPRDPILLQQYFQQNIQNVQNTANIELTANDLQKAFALAHPDKVKKKKKELEKVTA